MAVFGFDERTTHVGFADESSWSEKESNFRSIACISASVEDYCEIESRLYAARCRAGAKMAELKWSEDRKITGRKGEDYQRDADFILQAALKLAAEQKLRIDVIIWDKRDRESLAQQFNIRKMPNEWHLRNMYRTLITFVINRWRSNGNASLHYWSIAPDRHDGLDFRVLQNHIQSNVIPKNGRTVVEILEEKEAPNYSLQLVDIFAGLGAFSHNHWESYQWWRQQQKPIRFTPPRPAPQSQLRFPLLDQFYLDCSSNNLGIILLEQKPNFRGRGLWTRNPFISDHKINFWCYTLK